MISNHRQQQSAQLAHMATTLTLCMCLVTKASGMLVHVVYSYHAESMEDTV